MIDINCDMGEINELLENNTYSLLMNHVTSINVACGGHAGDIKMMNKIIQIAKQKKVRVGAHPSYPDKENFGRYDLDLDQQELSNSIFTQINTLMNIAENYDVSIDHVKPHGALYNSAAKSKYLANLICNVVKKIDPSLPIMCLAESKMVSVIKSAGMIPISEAFADRTYENDGSLRKRSLDKALIENPDQATKQAMKIQFEKKVIAYDGTELSIDSSTICIHSDTANALDIAKSVRKGLNDS